MVLHFVMTMMVQKYRFKGASNLTEHLCTYNMEQLELYNLKDLKYGIIF